MTEKFISLRNLQFLLTEHLDVAALTKYPYFADHSREIHTCRYFFAYELPKISGLAARLKESGDGLTVAMKPEWFE